MDYTELANVAAAMVAAGKGLLAIDESTGTCCKRFAAMGVECTEETRRAYRDMLLTTPGLADHVSGVILYDETIRQSTADGRTFVEYLDEVGSGPSLIGATPEERAVTRMWTRRVDLNICEPLANGFRYSEGLPLFKERMITIPEAAEGLKQIAREKLKWLDGLMDDGREYIAGSSLTLADILLYCMLAFGNSVGQPFDANLTNVKPWFDRLAGRPSASA